MTSDLERWRSALAEAADSFDADRVMLGAPLLARVLPDFLAVSPIPLASMPLELRKFFEPFSGAGRRCYVLMRDGELVELGLTVPLDVAGAA